MHIERFVEAASHRYKIVGSSNLRVVLFWLPIASEEVGDLHLANFADLLLEDLLTDEHPVGLLLLLAAFSVLLGDL